MQQNNADGLIKFLTLVSLTLGIIVSAHAISKWR